jgi:hypothetical protein
MREDLFDEPVWFPPEHLPDLSGEKILTLETWGQGGLETMETS